MPTTRSPTAASHPTRRKRSSPTAAAKEPIPSSGSSSSLVYPVPTSVVWLEQLALTITATNHKKKRSDVRYVLTVEHAKSKSTWNHVRTFDDYRQFQKRLQKALRHGHFCHAECPWLFTYLKSYFPKASMFADILATAHVMEQRRESLQSCFQTLQSFLVNRGNHCCSVLTSSVADELMAFINGEEGTAHQERLGFAPTPTSSAGGSVNNVFATASRKSWESNSPSEAEESCVEVHESDQSEIEHEGMCRLCNSRLEAEAYADSPSAGLASPSVAVVEPSSSPATESAPATPTATAASDLPSPIPIRKASSKTRRHPSHKHFYTTRLDCGHHFHDECIVPRLNEAMNCPTCGHHVKR